MAESTYNQYQGSFLGPLFPLESDLSRSRRKRLLSSASLVLGSSRPFSSVDRDDNDDERQILSYLPEGGRRLTPKTKRLLTRVTKQYVYGDRNENDTPVKLSEVLDVIDEEYKSYDRPVKINEFVFSGSDSQLDIDRVAAKIVSFAALNGLPKELTLLLLRGEGEFEGYRAALDACGWSKVSFPRGLAIRKKRRFVDQFAERYFPLPRSWVITRKQATKIADKFLYEASVTSAPIRRLLTKEEFLVSMEQVFGKTKKSSKKMFREALQTFPRRQKQVWKRFTEFTSSQVDRLITKGRAGTVAYSFVNLAWWTGAVIWQWRRLFALIPGVSQSASLAVALGRLAKALFTMYIAAQVTKIPRIRLATLLAPIGNWAIKATQKRLKVSETRAVSILNNSLGVVFLLTSATLVTLNTGISHVLQSQSHR